MRINDLFIFIYIAVLIVGTVAITISFILNVKLRGKLQKALLVFFSLLFTYALTDFLTYYYLLERISEQAVYILITVSDSLFIIMAGTWLYLIAVMSHMEETITPKWVAAVTCLYLLLQEGSSLLIGTYQHGSIQISSQAGRYFIQILCILYTAMNLAVVTVCAYRVAVREERGPTRTLHLIFSFSFMCYMAWVACWDYSVWFRTKSKLPVEYAFDMIFFIYLLLAVSVTVYFAKRDPLKLAAKSISSEEAVRLISNQYALTAREAEVLQQINDGKSNVQIAAILCISENTVKRHINSIMKKTQSHNRHEILFKLSNASEMDR